MIVLGLLALVAVVVVLAGHDAGDVAVVLGPLTPIAFLALGRRDSKAEPES